jgi:RNA polymerase sigma factor (sigma-70 family)
MATSQLGRVIQTVRSATLHHEEAALTDGQLLEGYVSSREEAAFAALLRRHGPMVWGVCRRLLPYHEAEDAFQATFLVLVKKAASVKPRELVGNWLYGVAHQTALKARVTAARRRGREKQVAAMPEPEAARQDLWDDLRPLLDQELSRLPDKYRAVIVLCELEGKTRKEAARHFRLPEGTVASRLATARAMLARRLARHGRAVSGPALAAALAQNLASAAMPASLATSTISAASLFAAGQAAAAGVTSVKAVALAEGVLKTMLLSKLKSATTALLAVALLGATAAALPQLVVGDRPEDAAVTEKPALAEQPPNSPVKEKKEPVRRPVKETKEAEALPAAVRGVARAVDAEKRTLAVAHDERETTFELPDDASITIDGKPGKLAGLPAGAHVYLTRFVDRGTVRSIEAQGANVGGVAKAVDAEKRTITVNDRTFTVADDACIGIDCQAGKLDGVPAGACVALTLRVDQKTVGHLSASGRSVFASVKAVDPENNTITVAGSDDDGRTFSVPAGTPVTIDGKPGKLAAIPKGASLHALNLRVDQRTAAGINVCGPGLQHVPVKAVDAEKGTVTFGEQAPADVAGKTLPVAADADVQIDGKPGKLAAVPPGCFVNVGLSADRRTALNLQAEGPNLGGCGGSMVRAVDAEKGTITFEDRAAPDVAGKTFTVAKDASVAIDDKPGKLAGVPPGSFVGVTLTVDRRAVRSLGARGPRLACVVKAVDAEKRTITVADTTYAVAKDANVVIGGKLKPLADLAAGAAVNLSFRVDQKTVCMIHTNAP